MLSCVTTGFLHAVYSSVLQMVFYVQFWVTTDFLHRACMQFKMVTTRLLHAVYV